MNVYVNGQRINLKPSQAIGKGGEAEVFKLGTNQALKLFKAADHPDYQNSPPQQQAAQARLAQHQHKLPLFPPNLPDRVIRPQELVTDRSGQTIIGYTMPLLSGAEVLNKYAQRSFRQAGISNQTVVQIFQDLHHTLTQLHLAQVLIGDFNDLNVLVKGTKAYLIDADSFQYASFPCQVFTIRFVDPLLCDPQAQQLSLQKSYSVDSDWYAFNVMLMQCLLLVSPYGGVYRPQDPAQRIPQDLRSLKRITVFHPEVKYPKPAIPYQVLPDDLLHHFTQVFEQDQRQEFPRHLLDHLHWQTCSHCGREHARSSCPDCVTTVSVTVTVVQGKVTAQPLFTTSGLILAANLSGSELQWLYHEQGNYKRENEAIVFSGDLDPYLRFGLQRESTVVGKQERLIMFKPGQPPRQIAIDSYNQIAQFATNQSSLYWLHNGQLLREGRLGADYIGDVLVGRSQFWVGARFGFGFYSASNLHVAFVFDRQKQGINDQVKLPRWSGQLLDATCVFSEQLGWFFWATQDRGQIFHHCAVIQPNGEIIATTQAQPHETGWLAHLQGKCAIDNFLFAATDEGIVRLAPHQGQIVITNEFPDTEAFVDSHSRLIAAAQGLYVIKPQSIYLLQLS
jgi:serine/threonine protein kinase